jgi:hypothetical protein
VSAHMVSAEEARQLCDAGGCGDQEADALLSIAAPALAHTVVLQAEQIAAVLALCDKWASVYNTPMREADATVQAIVYQTRATLGVTK